MWKVILRLAMFAVAAAALAQTHSGGVNPKFKKVTPEELKSMVDKKANFYFLDVREPDELKKLGTVEGYHNIPLSQLEGRVSEIPKDAVIVSACNRAVRASRAAEILEKHGYKQISVCAMQEYNEKGYPRVYPKEGGSKK